MEVRDKKVVRQELTIKYSGHMDTGPDGLDLIENAIQVMLRFKVETFRFKKRKDGDIDLNCEPMVAQNHQRPFLLFMRDLFSHLPLNTFELRLPSEMVAQDNPIFEVTR